MTNNGVPYHLVSLFLVQSVRLRSLQGSFSNLSVTSSSSKLILQPFRRFTYATAHSPTLPLLYLSHSSFSNPSFASSTSQLILQPLFRFSYVTGSSLTSPGEPPMLFSCFGRYYHLSKYSTVFWTPCIWYHTRRRFLIIILLSWLKRRMKVLSCLSKFEMWMKECVEGRWE